MNDLDHRRAVFPQHADAAKLALHVVRAEEALHAFTSGQLDAIIDSGGNPYLLRPAQAQLRQSERTLEATLHSAADLIAVVNRNGEIISHNRAALRLLGRGPGSLVGSTFFELVHPEDLPALYAAFFNVIDGFRTDATVEFRHHPSTGKDRVLEAAVNQLRDASIAGVVLVCRDITRRRRSEHEAKEREATLAETARAKDRVMAVIAHELRAPLTPALLGLTALQDDVLLPSGQLLLGMIRRNLELQSKLLDQLTDFTAVREKKIRLRPEPIDAHQAVGFVLEMCQSEISARPVKIVLDLRASHSHVLADSVKLQQILWNLLKNAIKFSPPDGSISITSANGRAGLLTLVFTDHGIGIAADVLPLIFDAFEQGDGTMHHRHGGLGLGLFIAKGLAEAQLGTLSAESEGPGQGATFRLSLETTRETIWSRWPI